MLHSATAGQMLVFLSFVFWGIVLSFAFHILCAVCEKKCDRVLRLALDTVFGVGALFVLWWANFTFNDGQFRLFIVLAIALGVFLYCKICKSPIDKACYSLYNLFAKKIADRSNNENDIPK